MKVPNVTDAQEGFLAEQSKHTCVRTGKATYGQAARTIRVAQSREAGGQAGQAGRQAGIGMAENRESRLRCGTPKVRSFVGLEAHTLSGRTLQRREDLVALRLWHFRIRRRHSGCHKLP
jgi:hypothetical protein